MQADKGPLRKLDERSPMPVLFQMMFSPHSRRTHLRTNPNLFGWDADAVEAARFEWFARTRQVGVLRENPAPLATRLICQHVASEEVLTTYFSSAEFEDSFLVGDVGRAELLAKHVTAYARATCPEWVAEVAMLELVTWRAGRWCGTDAPSTTPGPDMDLHLRKTTPATILALQYNVDEWMAQMEADEVLPDAQLYGLLSTWGAPPPVLDVAPPEAEPRIICVQPATPRPVMMRLPDWVAALAPDDATLTIRAGDLRHGAAVALIAARVLEYIDDPR